MANKTVKILDFTISEGGPIYLIAEIGINHNGDLQTAKKLMDAAFACNWNCVKFQKRTPEICVPEPQKKVLRDTPWGRITYLEYRHKVEFGDKEFSYIDRYCKEKPLAWSASAWDSPSLDFLLAHDVPLIKKPSAKLGEDQLLSQAARSGKPVILSTGMATLEEIDHAVELLEKYSRGDYVLMHANSTYPAPPEELNLLTIQTLQKRYRCLVGYSGHETELEPSVVAAALGARIIERHVTLSHRMWGSDHGASLEVHAMDLLGKRIRAIQPILGDGVKRLTPKEAETRKKLRGS